MGSFVKAGDVDTRYSLGDGAYSNKFIENLKGINLALDVNKEVGLFYYRAFNGTNNGLQNIYNYTEVLSPFLDLNFLEKALTIPLELRQNHYVYKKWILSKYPQAAEYEWETTGRKIVDVLATNRPRTLKSIIHSSLKSPIKKLKRIITNKKINEAEKQETPKGMNPVEYYLTHNQELYNYLMEYFQFVDFISDSKLRNILLDIGDSGTVTEKLQAVSLLGAIKLFYN